MSETTPGEKDSDIEAARAARIGSARSDFIGSLGRRVSELRNSLNALEQDPRSPRLRDDLRRRVHALSAGARLLRFSGMATALAEAERTLERAASVGGLDGSDVRAISALFETLPSLVWNEPTHEQGATERPPPSLAKGEATVVPPTVLVVGPSGLADAITHSIDHTAEGDIECERTDAPGAALELARALAPDVAVVDADIPGVKDLIEKLGSDPLTEPMPVIVVGTWSLPEEGARWIALGASRALGKPLSPHELRKACIELGAGVGAFQQYPPLGQTTVDDLTARIIEEVKRGLPDALVQGRTTSIQLGDGSDVLAAVWSAVARIRDLITIKSGGAVRFSTLGPEGAFPIAPWWGDNSTAVQRGAEAKPESDSPLQGRQVVVADDDPAVTWFIGGVLRAAGAEVREAHDGERALELCYRSSPNLVISDVLMPGLDGFALCRALKRDIALRDVPVILLSWKEDLLQRLRDLGADADGYLRKEASAAAILQRVYEVLRTRIRIETRLRGEGEVRGRLDGVTPRTLLEVTSRSRPDARVCVRDASFLYEVELRGGDPKSSTRTTSDGSFQRGKDVFGALLGVRAGRFVVSRATGPARGTLQGDLAGQLEEPIAHARAALRLLGGTHLLEVHQVNVAMDRVVAYLAATPEPARSLVTRIAGGASPRALILASEVAPAELEEVLSDLATHGAVLGVRGSAGVDLLAPALEKERAALRRGTSPSNHPELEKDLNPPRWATPAPFPAATSVAPRPVVTPRKAPEPPDPKPSKVRVGTGVDLAPMLHVGEYADTQVDKPSVRSPAPLKGKSTPDASEPSAPEKRVDVSAHADDDDFDDDLAPSSLEAAVIRQISERTPAPAPAISELAVSIVDTSALKARLPAGPTLGSEPNLAAIPSLPPDAVVPGSTSEDRIKTSTLASTSPSFAPDRTLVAPSAVLPREPVDPTAETPLAPDAPSAPPKAPSRSSFVPAGVAAVLLMGVLGLGLHYGRERVGEKVPVPSPADPGLAPTALSTVVAPVPAAVPSVLAAAPSGSSAASPPGPSAAADMVVDSPGSTAAGAMSAVANVAPAGAAGSAAAGAGGSVVPAGAIGSVAPASASSATPTAGEDLPLPNGAVVTPGQGLLDIETGGREAIFVDGIELGRGPFLRLMLAPGVHEVRLRVRGEDRVRFVVIRATRRTRLPLSSPWVR